MKVTIKFESVSPANLAMIHEVAKSAKVVFKEGQDEQSFMTISKSSLAANETYTVFLTIETVLIERSDHGYHRKKRKTSRSPLLVIFDALGILPENEEPLSLF